ncbi:MAG TPA: hypothetical protein VLE51_02255 [Candidatus Saccharimonadales bacterium]|nr:hypothetical protein [Candidatus Saccharimonadales bacterium]
MPPTFNNYGFKFEEGEEVEHIEGWPSNVVREIDKWHLEGYDTFSDESYTLAVNVDDEATARLLARAAMRSLEETQPSVSSGGQGGIQDKVYIIHPQGRTERHHGF